MSESKYITSLNNHEFLERYAAPGRIGLSGGTKFIDKAICRAERHLDKRRRWGVWSHAFIFQGKRVDGHHWVIESDLQIQSKHIQLGVQENRVAKYHDEKLYASLAVLDLGLKPEQAELLLRESLDLSSGEIAVQLDAIYDFIHRRLVAGNVSKTPGPAPSPQWARSGPGSAVSGSMRARKCPPLST